MKQRYEEDIIFAQLVGYEEGEEHGKQEGKLETAISMLKEGLDMALVKKITGLTENQILNIEQELNVG